MVRVQKKPLIIDYLLLFKDFFGILHRLYTALNSTLNLIEANSRKYYLDD